MHQFRTLSKATKTSCSRPPSRRTFSPAEISWESKRSGRSQRPLNSLTTQASQRSRAHDRSRNLRLCRRRRWNPQSQQGRRSRKTSAMIISITTRTPSKTTTQNWRRSKISERQQRNPVAISSLAFDSKLHFLAFIFPTSRAHFFLPSVTCCKYLNPFLRFILPCLRSYVIPKRILDDKILLENEVTRKYFSTTFWGI